MKKKTKHPAQALTQSPSDSDGISSQDSFSPRDNKKTVENRTRFGTENSESPASGMRSPGLLRENVKGKDTNHP